MEYKCIVFKRYLVGVLQVTDRNAIPKLVLGNVSQSLPFLKPLVKRDGFFVKQRKPKLPDLWRFLLLVDRQLWWGFFPCSKFDLHYALPTGLRCSFECCLLSEHLRGRLVDVQFVWITGTVAGEV